VSNEFFNQITTKFLLFLKGPHVFSSERSSAIVWISKGISKGLMFAFGASRSGIFECQTPMRACNESRKHR
jgi:hypothetical protein